jgi:tetratricopeptide (TPR) repeat protein
MIDPLIDAGEMPNLKRFVTEGVRGNIATLTPPLSPMLWTSIATGKTADKHGILGFAEPDGVSGKSRPVTSSGRTCKALWNILSDAGRPSGAINWFASHPAELINGFVVTDRFAHPTGPLSLDEPDLGWAKVPHSVWPEEDLDPLASVRVHPQMISQDQVIEFIPDATSEESARWEKVRELRMLLAHCASVHNAATAYINHREWDFLGIYYDAIDRFAHAFMEFNPPKMSHVSEEDFERYQGVMRACYRFHDLMLGRLMNMIDEETAVILLSDHGFHSGVTRPHGTSAITDGQPAAWHRAYGMVAFWGPGIAKGTKVYGASLLDITPTVLDMLGMPAARDMDGVVLSQIWDEPSMPTPRIETYESREDRGAGLASVSDADVDEQIMSQLRQLGYLGADDAQSVTIDRKKNLAAVYQSLGKSDLAYEQYQEVMNLDSRTKGIRVAMAGCLLSLGKNELAEQELTLAIAQDGEHARHCALRSLLEQRRGDSDSALMALDRAIELDEAVPGLYARRGVLLSGLDRLEEAEQAYEVALSRDPDDAEAFDGLGVVYHRTDRFVEAVHAFTRSIALIRHRPSTHLHLGDSLVRINRFAWAIEAYSEAARLSPGNPAPHDRLMELYERVVKNEQKAAFHRRRARMIREAHRAHAANKAEKSLEPHALTQFGSIPRRVHHHKGSDQPITIVSGLPRSGTSMMMQMLHAGGMPTLHDDERPADFSNPRGYFELQAVMHTPIDDSWVENAPGHAVKVIHAILRVLPSAYRYRVIFMKRDLDEVVASQSAMLERSNQPGSALNAEHLKAAYGREYERTGAWLADQPNFEVLELNYKGLVSSPDVWIERVCSFMRVPLNMVAMREVIDASLYRQRTGG